MPRMTIITLLTAAFAAFVPAAVAQADEIKENPLQGVAGKPDKAGRLSVNGIDYYYEIRGKGEPLLLLHGGLGQIEMFGENLKTLQEKRQVIGVDLQGHGRTPLGDRPIDIPAIGADMAELVTRLGYDKVDVLGYSFGGGVALQMAASAPDKVRRLHTHASAVHHVVERVRILSDQGPQSAWAIVTNAYVKTPQGWRMVLHPASPGMTRELQEISEAPSTLH